ncbi:MAG TPA: hypothetical protein VFA33_04875 [Bryobacteraceae bacterium]|nr:hypothetical protein [Bryobacteraceae bacterium]
MIEFSDDGPPQCQALHQGSLEDCEQVGDLCHAVSYSGSRPNPRARFVISKLEEDA